MTDCTQRGPMTDCTQRGPMTDCTQRGPTAVRRRGPKAVGRRGPTTVYENVGQRRSTAVDQRQSGIDRAVVRPWYTVAVHPWSTVAVHPWVTGWYRQLSLRGSLPAVPHCTVRTLLVSDCK